MSFSFLLNYPKNISYTIYVTLWLPTFIPCKTIYLHKKEKSY